MIGENAYHVGVKANKYPQECNICGEIVPAGKGSLSCIIGEGDNDVIWIVEHADKSECEAVKAQAKTAEERRKAADAIIAYIERFADGPVPGIPAQTTILFDRRRSHVGRTIEVDAGGNLYLVFHDPTADGWGSTHQRLEPTEDEGFGNSNADIVAALAALRDGQAVDPAPFKE